MCYNAIMTCYAHKEQIVSDVAPGSPGDRCGIVPGDILLTINGAPVIDLVDYEYLTANRRLAITLKGKDGTERTVKAVKTEAEPLGLSFATTMMDGMRTCKNHCVFCFIDQMPTGTRTSLHVKDDDWRMSFIMGNYVSLSNVDDEELERIIQRRVSPLYVSLHASDGAVRKKIMANPNAENIMTQLQKLADAGLRFHLQVVLCPGLNDGAVLEKTLSDAENLIPYAQSMAIVPVGLTRFREKLFPLRPWEPQEAEQLICRMEAFQKACLENKGTRFAFLSDEWYLLAKRPLPPYEAYEDFPQIENGVGLLRLFEDGFMAALEEQDVLATPKELLAAGGTAAAPFMKELMEALVPYGCKVELIPVENRFFGGNVSVGGLVTGQDLTNQLQGRVKGRNLLIPRNMLREGETVFLDGMTLDEAEAALGTRIVPFDDGEDFIHKVFGGKTI